MDPGTAIPDAVFEFKFTQVQPVYVPDPINIDEGWTFEVLTPATVGGLPTDIEIAFPDDLIDPQPAPGNLAQLYPGFNLGTLTFPHAGNFFFVITERPNTNPEIDDSERESIIYDDTAFLLVITVGNFVTGTPPTEQLRISDFLILSLGNANAPEYIPGTAGGPGTWAPGDYYWDAIDKLERYRPGQYIEDPNNPGEYIWYPEPSEIHFRNAYAFNDGPGNDGPINDEPINDRPINDRPINDQGQYARLSIEKVVVDNRQHANLTTDFTFNATLTIGEVTVENFNNGTITLPFNVVGFVQEQNAAGEWVTVYDDETPPAERVVIFTRQLVGSVPNVTGITYTAPDFELRDGQRLRFASNVPSGTTVSVTERALENWEVGSVYFNDPDPREITTTTNAAGDTIANSSTLVPVGVVTTAGDEMMRFNNDYQWSALMGLFIGSMPFMAALLAATVLLAMMVASRSRQRIEQLPIAY